MKKEVLKKIISELRVHGYDAQQAFFAPKEVDAIAQRLLKEGGSVSAEIDYDYYDSGYPSYSYNQDKLVLRNGRCAVQEYVSSTWHSGNSTERGSWMFWVDANGNPIGGRKNGSYMYNEMQGRYEHEEYDEDSELSEFMQQ